MAFCAKHGVRYFREYGEDCPSCEKARLKEVRKIRRRERFYELLWTAVGVIAGILLGELWTLLHR